jgi:hypothetical protein
MRQNKEIVNFLTQVNHFQEINFETDYERGVFLQSVRALHQLRVLARKIIDSFPRGDYSVKPIKGMIHASNSLRDIDVLMSEILPSILKHQPNRLKKLQNQLYSHRFYFYAQFISFIEDEFEPDCGELLNLNNSNHGMFEQNDFKTLQKTFLKEIKSLSRLDIDAKQIHKIRLKVKRYQQPFSQFQGYDLWQQTVAELRDVMGEFNDFSQAKRLLRMFVDENVDDLIMELEVKMLQAETKIKQKVIQLNSKEVKKLVSLKVS